MTRTIDWPAWAKPEQFEPVLARPSAVHRSDITATAQSVFIGIEVWSFVVSFRAANPAEAGRREALVNLLAGGGALVKLWHFARPAPFGTMRGMPTLEADAAQFAQSLSLTGAWAPTGRNLLRYSEDFTQSGAWSLGSGLSITSSGGPTSPDGVTPMQRVNGTANPYVYVLQASAVSAGANYTASIYVKAGTAASSGFAVYDYPSPSTPLAFVQLAWAGGIPSVSSSSGAGLVGSPSIQSIGGGIYRVSVTLSTLTYSSVAVLLYPDLAGASGNMFAWGAQFEQGALTAYLKTLAAVPGTLLAGDMVSLNGQLIQVADDALADGAGRITINTVNKLRRSVVAGALATWDKPTVTCFMPEDQSRSIYTGGVLSASSITLEEWV